MSRAEREGGSMAVEVGSSTLQEPVEINLAASLKIINHRSVHASHVTLGILLDLPTSLRYC